MTASFNVGDDVHHAKWGSGRVLAVNDVKVAVNFSTVGQKVIHRDFLKNANSKSGARAAHGPEPLTVVNAASLHPIPVPEREWHVDKLVPHRQVTMLAGDGGTGKSLLALMLAVSTAIGSPWLDVDVCPGPALYLSAEDDLDEIHRRLAQIVQRCHAELSHLADLHIVPLAGQDAVIASPVGRSNIIGATPLWQQLERAVEQITPRLIILDTLADLFSGEENSRPQARQFISLLRGAAMKHDATVLLLGHPSLAGMSSGTGSSGSTAWNNSVRSRLYFNRVFSRDDADPKSKVIENDPDVRVLSTVKSNYGRTGDEIQVRYCEGVFERQKGTGGGTSSERNATSESAFLSLLQLHEQLGIDVSPKPSTTYAPSIFAKHSRANGVTRIAFKFAMERLLEAKRIRVVTIGPPSKRRVRLTAYSDEPTNAGAA